MARRRHAPTSRRRRYHLDQDNAADGNQGLPAARYDAQQPLLLIGTLLLAPLIIPTGFLGVLQIPLVREHRRSVVKVQTQTIGAVHLLESELDFLPCHLPWLLHVRPIVPRCAPEPPLFPAEPTLRLHGLDRGA